MTEPVSLSRLMLVQEMLRAAELPVFEAEIAAVIAELRKARKDDGSGDYKCGCDITPFCTIHGAPMRPAAIAANQEKP